MKYSRLTPEDETAFLDSLMDIWDEIGVDVLSSVAEEKRIKTKRTEYGHLAPYEQVTMRRSEVISIVTDNFAGRNHRLPEDQYRRIRDWMMNTPGHIVDRIVAQKRFTYKYYGA